MHYALSALVDKGLAKLGNFAEEKYKRGYAYILTVRGISGRAAITHRFMASNIEEYGALKAEIDPYRQKWMIILRPR